jgi:hypothetical protein
MVQRQEIHELQREKVAPKDIHQLKTRVAMKSTLMPTKKAKRTSKYVLLALPSFGTSLETYPERSTDTSAHKKGTAPKSHQ